MRLTKEGKPFFLGKLLAGDGVPRGGPEGGGPEGQSPSLKMLVGHVDVAEAIAVVKSPACREWRISPWRLDRPGHSWPYVAQARRGLAEEGRPARVQVSPSASTDRRPGRSRHGRCLPATRAARSNTSNPRHF
jgi:hypothetical protein